MKLCYKYIHAHMGNKNGSSKKQREKDHHDRNNRIVIDRKVKGLGLYNTRIISSENTCGHSIHPVLICDQKISIAMDKVNNTYGVLIAGTFLPDSYGFRIICDKFPGEIIEISDVAKNAPIYYDIESEKVVETICWIAMIIYDAPYHGTVMCYFPESKFKHVFTVVPKYQKII